MIDPDRWPADYFDARARFAELARSCGARLDARAVEAVGPRGERLSVDVASLGPVRPDRMIVLVGGVHGAEGFLGTAVQLQALRRLAHDGLPDGTGIAMIHAANPWGFAHGRRVDENNVDVNRNFIGACPPEPASLPGYVELDPLLNPCGAPGVRDEFRYWLGAGRSIVRDRGVAKLARAIAEGQYRFPQGLFYGGAAAGEACRTLQDLVLGLSASADRVIVLDVHSGLGRSAVAMLIGDGNVGAPEDRLDRLRGHYRRSVHLDRSADNLYDARGTFARWCRRSLDDKRCLYLCVEIGTVNPLTLLSALRRENQAHHWTPVGSAPRARTGRALLDVFAPRSRRWRRRSVAQGLDVLDRTLALPADLA